MSSFGNAFTSSVFTDLMQRIFSQKSNMTLYRNDEMHGVFFLWIFKYPNWHAYFLISISFSKNRGRWWNSSYSNYCGANFSNWVKDMEVGTDSPDIPVPSYILNQCMYPVLVRLWNLGLFTVRKTIIQPLMGLRLMIQ